MANIFENLNLKMYKRYPYDLSHEVKCSMKIGNLYPILAMDVVPGDKFDVQTHHVCKLQPMLAPVMHDINVKIDYFYVPYRLISDRFNEFVLQIDQTANPPYITTKSFFRRLREKFNESNPPFVGVFNSICVGSTWDFLGYPTPEQSYPLRATDQTDEDYMEEVRAWYDTFVAPLENDLHLTALPIIANEFIYANYYKWYLEQNNIDEWIQEGATNKDMSVFLADRLIACNRTNWERDYFTSALDNPQAGSPVTMSLGSTAPLVTTNANPWSVRSTVRYRASGGGTYYENDLKTRPVSLDANELVFGVNSGESAGGTENNISSTGAQIDVTEHTAADLSNATSIDVEEMRFNFRLQRLKELMNVAGNKVIDRLKALWGVNSSDARLHIPEYLGGGRSPLVVSSVLQQVNDANQDYPLGTQAGQGLSVGKASAFNRYFEEHGIVIGIMRIQPKTAYMQGIKRDLLRVSAFDFAMPQFGDVGEQPVYDIELYAKADNPTHAFGYQSRYADYKYLPDRVHGEFKTTLSYWHMARKFDNMPQLNEEFQKVTPTSVQSSVFPYPSADTVYVNIYHCIKSKRKLVPNIL